MKTLYLLRHAKSSWDDASMADFDRPLNKRGLKDAPRVGELMRERGATLDLVLCSPAVRTRETARLALAAAGLTPEVRFEKRLYEASTEDLMKIISEIDESIERVMLVGHNSGMENLLSYLTKDDHHMPTSALARFTLHDWKWRDIYEGGLSLDWLIRPKDFA
jgi:phosphohistidine phosphatase